MFENYRIEKTVINDEWDKFVSASETGTIFSLSTYLLALKACPVAYYCYKNETIKAGVILIENENKDRAINHNHVIYSGILFQKPQKEKNISQINSERFRVSSFIAGELPKIYNKLSLTLHPNIVDIRPFLWFNYGENLPHYKISVRYTSHIDIENFFEHKSLNDIELYSQASSSRRQEIRYGIKNNINTEAKFDSKNFMEFYYKTMKRQNINITKGVLDEMDNIITIINKANMGKMFVSSTNNGLVGSMAFFLLDDKKAYLLFSANDPGMRKTQTGTMVLWDAFRFLSKEGIKEIDLEGINSPARGWFKLSFGGSIIPYYHLSYDGTSVEHK